MNAAQSDLTLEESREIILSAAEERFRTYGFNKTTMVEIAKDVSMSAANLYRFFENKQDIAAACCDRCMCERADILRNVVREPAMKAQDRLQSFVLASLRYTHENSEKNSKISELVESVLSERQDILHKKVEIECSLIAEILAQGNETGEFEIDDVINTARTVHNALTLFQVPIFMPLYPLKEFENKAKDLVALLIKGLVKH